MTLEVGMSASTHFFDKSRRVGIGVVYKNNITMFFQDSGENGVGGLWCSVKMA